MPRTDVNVPTPDGECPSIVITPEGDGPWPAVILYIDAGGVRAVDGRRWPNGWRRWATSRSSPRCTTADGPYEPFDMATVFGDADERAAVVRR